MRSVPSRLLSLASCLALAAACGGDDGGSATPDAPRADAGPGVDAPPAPGCDYAEQADLTNDDYAGGGPPEATGLTLTPTSSTARICGSLAADHYDADEQLVDGDGFTFTVAEDMDVLITVSGAGAEDLALVAMDVYSGASLTTYITTADYVGSHGAASARLTAGTHELLLVALHDQAITAPISYAITVTPDSPATRCAPVTTGGYSEAEAGAAGTNDVVSITVGQTLITQTESASTEDAAEATGVTLAAGARERFAGTLADVATPDSYEDKDTYAFTTGATTDQMTVHVTWAGAGTDVDFFLYESGGIPSVVASRKTSTTSGELRTFAVRPNTSYALLVGARATSTGLPATYDATVCGAAFAP